MARPFSRVSQGKFDDFMNKLMVAQDMANFIIARLQVEKNGCAELGSFPTCIQAFIE
jgi:hypothetical protein